MLKFDVEGKESQISVITIDTEDWTRYDEEIWEANVMADMIEGGVECDEEGRWVVDREEYRALEDSAREYAEHWDVEDSRYKYEAILS